MDLIVTALLGLIGFVIGNFLFSSVGVWIGTIYEIAKDPNKESKAVRLVSATFLSSGLWFLIVTVALAAFVRSQSWSTPIFIGAVAAIIFFSLFTAYYVRKSKAQRGNAA
jgi:MFS family permease